MGLNVKLSNVRAEKSLLGCLLRGPTEYWPIASTVTAEMFTVPLHQQIFTAIVEVCEAGTAARNVITPVSAKLDGIEVEGDDIEAFLEVMRANAEDAGAAVEYSGLVVECWQARAMLELSKWQEKQILSGLKPMNEIAEEYTGKYQDILAKASPISVMHISEAMDAVLQDAAKAYQNREDVVGYTTGLPSLDNIMGPMMDTDLVFILGAQGDSKTSLAAQIGIFNAKASTQAVRRNVMFVQMEMTEKQMAAREMAQRAGVNVEYITTAKFDDDMLEYSSLVDIQREYNSCNFWIVGGDKRSGQLTLGKIEAEARKRKRQFGGSLLLIIDQLDKIATTSRYVNKADPHEEVTRDLKLMARRLEIPVICLAQRKRGAQTRGNPTPSINDGTARSIEHNADTIIAVYSRFSWLMQNPPEANSKTAQEDADKWEAEKEASKDTREIICLKRRRGRPFQQAKFAWVGEQTMFVDNMQQVPY